MIQQGEWKAERERQRGEKIKFWQRGGNILQPKYDWVTVSSSLLPLHLWGCDTAQHKRMHAHNHTHFSSFQGKDLPAWMTSNWWGYADYQHHHNLGFTYSQNDNIFKTDIMIIIIITYNYYITLQIGTEMPNFVKKKKNLTPTHTLMNAREQTMHACTQIQCAIYTHSLKPAPTAPKHTDTGRCPL